MADGQAQQLGERHRNERRQRQLAWCFRWRWPLTLLYVFDLCGSAVDVWRQRAEWPGLSDMHGWARLSDFGSVGWAAFGVAVWTLALAMTWLAAGRHRREQARADQERRYGKAAADGHVWPPPAAVLVPRGPGRVGASTSCGVGRGRGASSQSETKSEVGADGTERQRDGGRA